MRTNRRNWIKLAGSGAAAIYLGGLSALETQAGSHVKKDLLAGYGPFDRSLPDIAPQVFSGDEPRIPHQILWDKTKFIKSLSPKFPAATEKAKLVVVGGGISGLMTAYELRKYNPVVLEQSPRFGGNTRGESWRGIDYSIGAAYIGVPDKGDPIDSFFKDLQLDKTYKIREGADAVYIDGAQVPDIWSTGTNPEDQKQFQKLTQHIKELNHSEGIRGVPDPFSTDPAQKAYVARLDQISFKRYLEDLFGGPVLPRVEDVVDHYFWSAVSVTYSEISATAGLFFLAGDFEQVAIFPGGNGAISEVVLSRLEGRADLRPRSLVFDLRTTEKGILVSYADKDLKVRTIDAQAVVMCCPKFVVKHIIDDLEAERLAAYQKLRYRSYLLANVLIDTPVRDDFYDIFFFGKAQAKFAEQGITDFVYSNYAVSKKSPVVITLYQGLPYDSGRNEVYSADAYQKYRQHFEAQIESQILPILKVSKKNVVDIRLVRWGHPLPVPDVGHVASGRCEWFRKPFRGKVFFIEQDNWALPAFETCFSEVAAWAPEIRKVLI